MIKNKASVLGRGAESASTKILQMNNERKNRRSDEHSLPPGGGALGHVDEFDGAGGVKIEGFFPTKHELIRLAKYWATVAIEIEFNWFLDGKIYGIRKGQFAWERIGEIANFLGDKEIQKAVQQAEDEFGKRKDPELWRIFTERTHRMAEECDPITKSI